MVHILKNFFNKIYINVNHRDAEWLKISKWLTTHDFYTPMKRTYLNDIPHTIDKFIILHSSFYSTYSPPTSKNT